MESRFNLYTNDLGAKLGKRFANVSLAIMQSLPKILVELVELRVSQINGCGYCVDAHAKELAAAGEPAVRVNLVAAWRESTVFTEAERAALAPAESDHPEMVVPPRTQERTRRELLCRNDSRPLGRIGHRSGW